jgi:hypothetical protein
MYSIDSIHKGLGTMSNTGQQILLTIVVSPTTTSLSTDAPAHTQNGIHKFIIIFFCK